MAALARYADQAWATQLADLGPERRVATLLAYTHVLTGSARDDVSGYRRARRGAVVETGLVAGRADYAGALHLGNDQGRAVSPEAAGVWQEALARRLPTRRPLTVVDLGTGTGRFTDLIVDEAGGLVLGVEPAEKMRNPSASGGALPRWPSRGASPGLEQR